MRLRTLGLFVVPAAIGCADVLGFGDGTISTAGGAAGNGGSGTTSGGGTAGAAGAGGMAGSAGAAGAGGVAGAGGTMSTDECMPSAVGSCYDGPPGTEGIGECRPGQRTCDASGKWGPCDAAQTLPRAEDCSTHSVDESCDQLAECTGQFRRARLFAAGMDQLPQRIATDSKGNSIVVGSFKGTVDFGDKGGPLTADVQDAFVVKLDPQGKTLWARRFGHGGSEAASSVAVDPKDDSIVIGGAFSADIDFDGVTFTSKGAGDAFVAKLTPDGAVVWSDSHGSPLQEGVTSVAIDANGNMIIGGNMVATLDLGGGELQSGTGDANPFVAKYTPEGKHVWSYVYGAPSVQTLTRVAADKAGDVLLFASGAGGIRFGPKEPVLEADATDSADSDFFAVKLSGIDGAALWSHVYGGMGNEIAVDMAVASDGSSVFFGHSNGDGDFGLGLPQIGQGLQDLCLWKVSSSGNTVWHRRAGDVVAQNASGLALDAQDNIIAAFSFSGTVNFGVPLTAAGMNIDRGIVKLGPDGVQLWWARQFPAGLGSNTRVAVDPLGNVLFGCALYGSTNFGGGQLNGAGDADLVIGALSP